MRILLIAQEPPLSPERVVTGNAIRTDQLTRGLAAAGHRVTHLWHSGHGPATDASFATRDELRDRLLRHAPDLCLVCYWELLDFIPFELEVPVLLDFLAPRPLEELFEHPERVQSQLHRLRINLTKVDRVLVGHARQRELLLLTLLDAGLDLREETPVDVVPLAAEPAGMPRSVPERDGWVLVAGGVDWPWRDATAYWQALEEAATAGAMPAELVLFGGSYRLREGDPAQSDHPVSARPLQPYADFSRFLLSRAHIGLELARENVERRHSQSFRALEFLRHGLPLICNAYLPIAAQIEAYDAGWLIDGPAELLPLLKRITADPDGWRRKSRQASRLVEEAYGPGTAMQPLLEWLDRPRKAPHLPRAREAPPSLAVPPPLTRARRMAALAINHLKNRIFRVLQARFGGHAADGVVLVSRGDLFPADHGAAVKIVETARGLSRIGRPVALVTDDRHRWWQLHDGELVPRPFPLWVRLASRPAAWVKLLHMSKDIPASNAFLYLPLSDNSFYWRLLHAGRRIEAGVIQAEFPAYAAPAIPAAHVLGARVVLVEHNVEYERLKVQVPELTEEQYQRYKSIEIDLCNRVDAVVCVSDNDRQRLAMDGVQPSRLHTIPHGVDLEQFALPARASMRAEFGIGEHEPVLVYHGTFSYAPNMQALELFASELLPRLERRGETCHVLAVGREPPAVSPHPRIHLTGSVDRVGPWLKAADIAVIPLLEGGGTRMKIIDCFAAGLPVISTTKGIEGIPVVNGEQALIIDDWADMCEAIRSIIHDRERAHALAAAGEELARDLDWKAIARHYAELYESL